RSNSSLNVSSPRPKTPNRIQIRDAIALGYGRRSCPGQFLAEDGLFIAIFTTLAVFHIVPVDKTAKEVKYTSGIIRYDCFSACSTRLISCHSHTKSLECLLTPRSKEAVSLLR
ncbi:hypothetical protein DFH09DRAFT_1165062, partial [Mycena vulgaris]